MLPRQLIWFTVYLFYSIWLCIVGLSIASQYFRPVNCFEQTNKHKNCRKFAWNIRQVFTSKLFEGIKPFVSKHMFKIPTNVWCLSKIQDRNNLLKIFSLKYQRQSFLWSKKCFSFRAFKYWGQRWVSWMLCKLVISNIVLWFMTDPPQQDYNLHYANSSHKIWCKNLHKTVFVDFKNMKKTYYLIPTLWVDICDDRKDF